jgi:hypothetical protein
MHETPRRHGREIVAERPLVEFGHAAQQQSFDAVGRGLKRRVFRPLGQDGPEHQAKKTAILQGELDISKAGAAQEIGSARRALHRRAEFAETLGGDRSKKILLAGEMAVGGRR